MTQNPVSPEQQARSRRIMLLVFGIFLLPVIIAYSAHFFGWYEKLGTNNRGQLITPPIDVTQLQLVDAEGRPFDLGNQAPTWHLVYIMPKFFGLNGVWFSFPIADVLSTLVTVIFLKREVDKKLSFDTLSK